MKKYKILLASLALGAASFIMFGSPHAFAATKTWTGGGSDTNLSTGANWGGTAPSAADDLVFPITVSNKTVVNDMTAGTSFHSITFSGAASANGGYTISGNGIAVTNGITDSISGGHFVVNTLSLPIAFSSNQTISLNNDNSLTFSGVLSGSGNLTFTGGTNQSVDLHVANTFTGTVTTDIKLFVDNSAGLGTSAGGTTVNTGGAVQYGVDGNTEKTATITEPFTLNTGATNGFAVLYVSAGCGLSTCSDSDLTLSGPIVLGADVTMDGAGIIRLTGALSGAHTIALSSSSPASLIINGSSNTTNTANGSYGAGAGTTTTYADDQPNQALLITQGNTGIVTGTYGDVNVTGTLKGTGTVNNLDIAAGGIFAPGMSPGCFTVNGSLTLSGTYQAELGGTTACTEYDQIKVANSSTIVSLDTGTLAVSLYNGFKPTTGQKFTIVDNASSAAITGTFSGLAEGATFTAGGYNFSISYVGGDGNDVVLTSLGAAPDTGFALIKNNPFATMGIMLGLAGAIAYMARKQMKPAARRR